MSPSKAKKECSYPGCHQLVNNGYCEVHNKKLNKERDQYRKSPSQRGYNYKWSQYSKWRIVNIEPFCRQCNKIGRITDHIIPFVTPDDSLFWDENNHQTLCDECHNKKRATEDKNTWKERRDNNTR